MKKITSIVLLALMGLCMFCVYPLLKLLQLHAKEVAAADIRDPSPGKLVVYDGLKNNKEVVWEKEDAEFRYRGTMYDVVKKGVRGGKILYYCYADRNESTIVSLIEKLVRSQAGDSNNTNDDTLQLLLKLLAQVFMPSAQYMTSSFFAGDGHSAHYFYTAPAFPHHYRSVNIPPPKVS